MPLSEMQVSGGPLSDQIEVTIFGPNYGECIVIHLGNGNWVVHDSCLYDGQPVAPEYLQTLGLDPARSIKAIVATHWHDDHCKGLSQMLASAPFAHISIPLALTNREFLQFTARMNKNRTAVAGNKLREFSKIIREIARRREAGLVSFSYAQARTILYGLDAAVAGHGLPCQVMAISPAHADTARFMDRIAASMPARRKTKTVVASPSSNDVSVATLVSVGPLAMLLGADLENSGKSNAGWEGVIAAHQTQAFGPRASLYKIPHHGSATAHNTDVWAQLLTANPIAVLTPWQVGKGRLPTLDGARNILKLSPNAFVTSRDARSRTHRGTRPPGVLRFIRENKAIRLRSLVVPFGAIRFRTLDIQSAQWQCELFGTARGLAEATRRGRTAVR
jgi:hypothetical protein